MIFLRSVGMVIVGHLEFGLGAELPSQVIIPSSFVIADLASFVIADLASFAVVEASVSSIAIEPCQAIDTWRIQAAAIALDSLSCTLAVVAEKDPASNRRPW